MIRILLSLVLVSAFATSFVNRPISVAVQESDNIVRGTSGKSWFNWGSDKKRIFTYTKFSVTDVLKGGLKAGTDITLRSPGGTMDGMEMHVPGSAQFGEGEDVVLLLGSHNAEDDSYDIPGLTTGKYNTQKSADGQVTLVNSLGGGAIFDPSKPAGTLSYNSKIPLEVFRHIAKGEDVPEAAHNQFAGSNEAAPAGAYEAGHHHEEIRQVGTKPAAPPAPGKPNEEPQAAQPENRSLWVPLSFFALAAFGGVLTWWLLRSKDDAS